MSSLNPLEERLRGWQPLPPSPRLKARLFLKACNTSQAPAQGWPALVRHWTPVTIGLVLTGLLWCNRGPEGFPLAATGAASGNLLAAAFSNQFYAAYLPAVDHSSQNHSPAPRLRWTNEEAPSSTMRFFAQPRTNQIGMQP